MAREYIRYPTEQVAHSLAFRDLSIACWIAPIIPFDRFLFLPLFFKSSEVDAKTVTDAVSRDLAQTAQSSSLPTADLRYRDG